MSGRITVLLMSALMAFCAFGVGSLPLSFVFSKTHLAKLSALGTGLLLGTALGVIIPEGILVSSSSSPSSPPTTSIALSLLTGFTFMLLVEQLASPHSYAPALPMHSIKETTLILPEVQFDVDMNMGEPDSESSLLGGPRIRSPSPEMQPAFNEEHRAVPLTLGLVLHGLTDGLALGVSALSSNNSKASSDLSLVVFLALLIHKAPTALALTTSLLASSLPRSACRKHIAIFAGSTPVGAILSFEVFSFLGGAGASDWTGTALLLSGGTFLYVATVLQPVSNHRSSPATACEEIGVEKISKTTRVGLIVLGIFTPFVLDKLLGHGHALL